MASMTMMVKVIQTVQNISESNIIEMAAYRLAARVLSVYLVIIAATIG